MSDPMSSECVYCGSLDVMDDAWWCPKPECWAAYHRECEAHARLEARIPLSYGKARTDLMASGAGVWGHAYLAMVDAANRLVV